MKRRVDFRIIIIIVLIILLGVLLYTYFHEENAETNFDSQSTKELSLSEESTTSETLISTSTSVDSALTENIELHATYYLEECYVEEGDKVLSGENILKYTNGKYLVAPYDCIINSLNIPEEEAKCTNEHYIEVSSNNLLKVSLSVDETIIDKFYLGQTASITISALEDKEYSGYITNISNTASNGKFTIICEFENDGNIRIGMTAGVVIKS